jgi:formylglycine-generating enzyme required for sulfatase activity
MNLTSQYVVNPKVKKAYSNSNATYQSIQSSYSKIRLNEAREFLKPNRIRHVSFGISDVIFKMIYCQNGFMVDDLDFSEHEYDDDESQEYDEDEYYDDDNDNDDSQVESEDEYHKPKRLISINQSFLLGETEVTQELFEKAMGFNPSKYQGIHYPNSHKRPVDNVTWYDAVMFCNKLSERLNKKPYYNISNETYASSSSLSNIIHADVTCNLNSNGFRLPLGKEWVYAAKAGTNNQWAGTDNVSELKKVAWYEKNSNYTQPVKGKRPNEWGFYDMSGNVREWLWEWSEPAQYDLGLLNLFGNSISRNTLGGGVMDFDETLINFKRSPLQPNTRLEYLGFRIALYPFK